MKCYRIFNVFNQVDCQPEIYKTNEFVLGMFGCCPNHVHCIVQNLALLSDLSLNLGLKLIMDVECFTPNEK